MPIRFAYDQQLKVLIATAEGLVSFEDIQKHLDEEAAAGAIGCREIFDASAASTSLTSGEVRKIAERLHGWRSLPLGPTAIVTNNDVLFGMARMLEIICDLQGGPRFSVFRTFDEGLDWLGEPPNDGSAALSRSSLTAGTEYCLPEKSSS
jgi:hypothetical protein